MLRWRNLHFALPAPQGCKSVTECCGVIPRERVIYAVVSPQDQKRGQPPWRYRCETCGPTQADLDYAELVARRDGRVVPAAASEQRPLNTKRDPE